MTYTHNLIPTPLPAWLDFDGRTWDTHYLSPEQLADHGWLPLVQDPEGALLGYAAPVAETRDGHLVAVAYALATPEQEAAERLALLRANAHALRSAERMTREATTYLYDGHRYHCDQRSVDRRTEVDKLAVIAAMSGAPDTVIVPSGWRDVDGVPRLYTAAQLIASQQAFVEFGGACDDASMAIKADIDSAETIEALEAIIAAIPTDARWPA